MAGQSFWVRGLVLRKTKMGESDLIVELLNDEGCLVRAVAKGARKPKSSFASRLELGNSVELLCASGRGLAIVQECRLVSARMGLRQDYDRLVCTEVLLELLSKCTQEDLPQPKLLAVAEAALDALAAAPAAAALGLLAAAFLKVLAFVGLRPELRRCVVCGRPAAGAHPLFRLRGGRGVRRVRFAGGGPLLPGRGALCRRLFAPYAVCPDCRSTGCLRSCP